MPVDFYLKNNDKQKALPQLLSTKKWYENRITQLWEGSFDVSNIRFWNIRSCLDGSRTAHEKYSTMYNSLETERLRWLTHLIYCYDALDAVEKKLVKEKLVKENSIQKENQTTLCSDIICRTEKSVIIPPLSKWFWFKTTTWAGKLNCDLVVYKENTEGYPYRLDVEIIQQKNEVIEVSKKITFNGLIKKDGTTYFTGYDNTYHRFPLLQVKDKVITLSFFYKTIFPSAPYPTQELVHQLDVSFHCTELTKLVD